MLNPLLAEMLSIGYGGMPAFAKCFLSPLYEHDTTGLYHVLLCTIITTFYSIKHRGIQFESCPWAV